VDGKFLLTATLLFVGCTASVDDYDGWSAGKSTSALTGSLRIFVTSQLYAPTFGDIYGADAICAQHASNAGLGGKWKAWLSTSKIAAPMRMRGRGPWTLVDGATVVFADRNGGFLSPLHAIDRNERGEATPKGLPVWTGTSHLGEPSTACIDWSADKLNAMGQIGEIAAEGTGWTASRSVPCVGGAYLYCFEQP
jgi:hypothetical protein